MSELKEAIEVNDIEKLDLEVLSRAALLCKSDLVSEVVTEFPNLQGIIGYHYALNDGESKKVALAIRDHYLPTNRYDKLPETIEGKFLSLSDKLDSLIVFYIAGERATGSKDPMALRRTAIAIIRLIVEGKLTINLKDMINEIYDIFEYSVETKSEIYKFINERLIGYIEEEYKYNKKNIQSVINQMKEQSLENLFLTIKKISEIET
jgi:glycyl-tRNA synthetase beta chain